MYTNYLTKKLPNGELLIIPTNGEIPLSTVVTKINRQLSWYGDAVFDLLVYRGAGSQRFLRVPSNDKGLFDLTKSHTETFTPKLHEQATQLWSTLPEAELNVAILSPTERQKIIERKD